MLIEPLSLKEYIDTKLVDGYEIVIPNIVQQLTQDVADVVGIYVRTKAEQAIDRHQKVLFECSACPKGKDEEENSKTI